MPQSFTHLGVYSDWVEAAKRHVSLCSVAPPGEQTRRQIRDTLGFTGLDSSIQNVRIEATWQRDGLAGEEIRALE